jgi:adenylate kinase
MLMAEFSIPQISTGDILRFNIAQGTALGRMAKSLIDAGHLVDDEIVQRMVGDRLDGHNDVMDGFLLDGFPRTLGQASWLDNHLHHIRSSALGTHREGRGITLPVVAIHIMVSYDELLRRITGRRICPTCKSIYNIYSNPPKVDDRCDVDSAQLTQRPDDTEAVFAERMNAFNEKTSKVIDYYRKEGRFKEVEGAQPVEQVTAAIIKALKDLRQPVPAV